MKESSYGLESYKARYVAKRFSHLEGINYKETFAPTATPTVTLIYGLVQVAAQQDLILH